MPIFYVLSGPDIGKTYELGAGAVLGRAIENAATLRGGSISRKHARLEQEGEKWALVDLDSRNGLHQDGKRVQRIELQEGGTFYVGEFELRFRIEAQGVSLERPAPPAREPQPAAQDDVQDEFELEFDDEDDEDDDEGITFEGADLFDAPAPAAAPVQAPKPGPTTGKPKPAAPSKAANRQAERMAAAGIRPPASVTPSSEGGRPALQYSKVQQSAGFFSNDLGQYPLWVRLGAGLLTLVVFVAVFYFAYRSTNTLKGRASSAAGADVELEAEE